MEAVTVVIAGEEVPLVRLGYDDVERAIQDWRIAGITDPLGQLIAWLRDQVAALVGAVRDAILGALSTVSSAITSAISGAITAITNAISSGISNLVNTITSGLTGLVGTISGVLSSAFNTLSSALTAAISGIANALSTAVTAITNAISAITGAISSAISGAVNAITGAISAIAGAISSAITGAVNAITAAVSGIANAITSALNSIVNTLTSALSGLASAVSSAISSIANTITSALSGLANTIASGLNSAVNAITGALGTVVASITAAISGLISQLSSLLSSLADRITSTIQSIIKGVSDAVTSLGQRIVEGFTGAFTALTNTLMSIFSNITGHLAKVAVAFEGFVNSIARLGDLIAGPLKGIADALTGFFKDPVGALTKALSDAWKGLVELTKPIWQPLQQFFDNAWKFLQQAWVNFTKALGDAWASFVKFTEPIWKPVKDFIDFVSKTVWDGINSFIKLFTERLEAFFKDPLGFITSQIAAAWSGFVEFTRPIWEPLKKFLDDAGKFLTDLWNGFTKALGDAWNALVEFTRPIWEPFKNFFDTAWKNFQDLLRDPIGTFSSVLSSMWSGFVEFTKPIWEPIGKFLDDTGKFFSDLFKTLSDWGGAVTKFIVEDIPRFFTQDLPKFLIEDLPNILFNIGKTVLSGLQTIGDAIFNAIKLVGELLLRAVVALIDVGRAVLEPPVRSLLNPAIDAMKEAVKPASPPPEVKEFVTVYQQLVMEQIEKTVKQVRKHDQVAPALLGSFAGLAISLGLIYASAQTGGLLADAVHPLKNLGVRKTVKSLIDNLGGFFIMSSLSASFTFFVIHPMLRRFYQKLLTPVIPGPDTMTTMYFRQTFTEQYYHEHMLELGYNDTFINGFIDVNANIPTVEQMIRLVGSGMLERSEALKQLKKAGWIGDRGWLGPETVFEGFKDPPSIERAFEMLFLGLLTQEEAKRIYMWRGRHEDYFEQELKSSYKMPPISDLITFVIREVIEPEDFKILVLKHGLQPKEVIKEVLGKAPQMPLIGGGRGEGDWADAYWEAHWRLPSPEQVFEFYNRAVVGMVSVGGTPFSISPTEAEKIVMAYTTIHDYKPEPRELAGFVKSKTGISKIPVADEQLVRSLRFRILTRIESRFVRRWGLISTEDYIRLGTAQGIDPYIKIKTLDGSEITMLDALTTAEFLQDLLEERTALRTQLINSFIKGFNIKSKIIYIKDKPGQVEEREFESLKLADALKLLRFRPEEVSWLVAQALIRREIEIREDRIKGVIEDFMAGLMKPEEFENELKPLIDDDEVRKTVVEFYTKRRIRQRLKRVHARLERDLLRELDTHLRLYEDGLGRKEDVTKLMDELVAKEFMTEEERSILLSISEMRRKRELIELAVRALAKKVGRGEITPETFLTEAEKLGVDKEFADKLLEVHTPFHTLSISTILSYADEVPIPESLLEKKLKNLRVPPDEAELVKLVAKRRTVADEIRSILSTFQSLARDLESTPGEAVEVLKAFGFTDAEIALRTKIMEKLNTVALRRQIRRTLDVLLREQYEALAKGRDPQLITLEQYVKVYRKMGYPDDFIIARAQEILANFKIPLNQWRTLKARLER
jgi:phage-related protein